ncbi:uncharacterized protein LOC132696596 [Cylas formicarius]|uniref:uncharacterized protein LOC132696596 n=1 Tax=Cylas formicarius TaxID=197179 RepID=UPI002958BD02|nr:uncharacterized protein LOC132696596 [Cylas formicarius]
MKDDNHLDQETFTESLTTVEKIISKQFKRVVTEVPGSKKWISGANVIRRLAIKCGAKHPQLLTSTRFRKHIATTLQLMTMQPHEIEQVVTFMGHTRKTHAQFYRLPQDIFQTVKVAKVLLLLEKGKGKVFKGKCLSEIEIEEEASILESSDEDAPTKKHTESSITQINQKPQSSGQIYNAPTFIMSSEDIQQTNHETEKTNCARDVLHVPEKSSQNKGRVKWNSKEKKLVLNYFKSHLEEKITPKKHECEEYVAKYRNNITITEWIKIKTLVYNTFRYKVINN